MDPILTSSLAAFVIGVALILFSRLLNPLTPLPLRSPSWV